MSPHCSSQQNLQGEKEFREVGTALYVGLGRVLGKSIYFGLYRTPTTAAEDKSEISDWHTDLLAPTGAVVTSDNAKNIIVWHHHAWS